MDFDGDGDADVLSGSWPGELYVFSRNEDGSFAAGEKIQDASGKVINTGNASTAFAVDWDADGDLDLITGNISGEVHLVLNGGSRTEPAYEEAVKLDVGAALARRGGDSGPIVADWDGDGLGDLLVGMGDGSVVWFRNTGRSGSPELGPGEELVPKSPFGFDLKSARPDQGEWGARVKIHVTDLNGDGRVDLLLGDRSGAPRTDKPTDQEREAAAEARRRITELRKELIATRAEVARLGGDEDASAKSRKPEPAELKEARRKHERLTEEYARLQETVGRAESNPRRHGFVWLFERRAVAEIAQKQR
ncbi:MAG TPA: VCBS repeat-containing protein [Planctomycetaceae bacterium]|nr:VCBS repeat-containing protein [Planctomycetaceae bacterium]